MHVELTRFRPAPRAAGAVAAGLVLGCSVAFAAAPSARAVDAPAAGRAPSAVARAVEAYRARDFTSALAQFSELAAAGEPRAQTILGIMHESGEGVTRDASIAASWYRLAAEQGYDPAQYSLANLYRTGRGVPRDDEEAAFWYAAAAQQGNQWAAARLGELPSQRTDAEPRSVVERSRATPSPARTGIAAERLDALVARLPGLREARRAAREAPPVVPADGHAGPGAAREAATGERSGPGTRPSQSVRGLDVSLQAPGSGPALAPPGSAEMLELVASRELGMQAAPGVGDGGPAALGPAEPMPEPAPSPGGGSIPGTMPVPALGPRAPGATARGSYAVQIAATRSRARTEREVARVARAVHELLPDTDPRVVRVDLGDQAGVWYRGHLGPFSTLAAAEAACQTILTRAQTQGCFSFTVSGR